MTSSSYERAVALSGRLLGSDVRRWERFVYLFAQVGCIDHTSNKEHQYGCYS